MSVDLNDRLSCAYHAAMERAEWHKYYGWEEKQNRHKQALKLARRSGELSVKDQVPEFIKNHSDLHLAYLVGLPDQYKSSKDDFFVVEKFDDLAEISPLKGVDSGCLRIKRGDSVPSLLNANSSPCYGSYDSYINEEPPVSELSGLYYDDYNDNPEFTLIYAVNFNSQISFGNAKRKGSFWADGYTFSYTELTMFTLVALHGILSCRLFEERTENELLGIRERALQIIGRTKQACFMPLDGVCYSCESDVTKVLANIPPDESITGCPKCGRTWCD